MPARRKSQTVKKNAERAAKPQVQHLEPSVIEPSVKEDILAVVLCVVAVMMVVSLVSPTSAYLTATVGHVLDLLFGVGAILCPVALVAYTVMHFVTHDQVKSRRIALSLILVVLAVLSLLSVNMGVRETQPMLVFEETYATHAGGYVGGALAWFLLTFVGRIVANVVLTGLLVTAALIGGLSFRKIGKGVATQVSKAKERRSQSTPTYAAGGASDDPIDELFADGEDPESVAPTQLFPTNAEGKTTYLGSRKTTVLKRDKKMDEPTIEMQKPAQKRHPRLSLLHREPAHEVEDTNTAEAQPGGDLNATVTVPTDKDGEVTETDNAVPAFLRNAARQDTDQPTPAKTLKRSAKAPKPHKRGAVAAGVAPIEPIVKAPSGIQPASAGSKGITPAGKSTDKEELPPLSLLESNPDSATSMSSNEELRETAQKLQETLAEFKLKSKVVGWVSGPLVTTFKISMGEGERVNKITNLEDDIALALATTSVRIFAPIPKTSLVGIEIPNKKRQSVCLGDVLPYAKGKSPLEVAFGRNTEGRPITVDIAKLPHLLVAGTTGSGKSVLLNSIIVSMLMRATPQQVRMIMIDPKRVEFTGYNGLPHLYVPVVTDAHQAAGALQWAVSEMERRLRVFEHYKVRDIKSFNRNLELGKWADMEHPPEHMPYFVIVIDELSDLMIIARKEVEASIVRIAQLGRAAGIHLIVATQRPSADVVTGLIKANIDNRVALAVDSAVNSRIILDSTGAERLLGAGDMLYKLRGRCAKRALGCYVSDDEIEAVVSFVKEHFDADLHSEILSAVTPGQMTDQDGAGVHEDDDPLMWEAAQLVVDSQLGSTSGLQRHLKVGYARAGRIMDMLEDKGIVGPPDGSKPREVLMDQAELEELRIAEEKYQEVE